MRDLILVEVLKLKNSKMFFISLAGAAVAPVFWLMTHYGYQLKHPEVITTADKAFYDINMFITLLIGVLLYGVITSYVFNREYAEDTLKTMLVIPVSRTKLIMSKAVMICAWILSLTLFAWGLTLLLCAIFSFPGIDLLMILNTLGFYLLSGILMFMVMTPVMFVALVYKNFVPTIVFTIGVVMLNVLFANSEYISLFPWSAPFAIVSGDPELKYPLAYSYISIILTSLSGMISCIMYFGKSDIQ